MTQLFCLVQRVKLMQTLGDKPGMFSPGVVGDFLFS